MNNQICEAIRTKRVLAFTYDGTARQVEPHAHGADLDGDESLRDWQIFGTGSGWRMFHTAKMTGLTTTDKTFSGPRPGYKKGDKDLAVIYCQL